MSVLKVDTVRPVTTNGSLTLQGDSSGAGVTGAKVFGDGSLGADSITDLAGSGAPDFTNGWKSEGLDAYACRAWVNFNGTGTVAIRASGNVSSITDNGTGLYTINFSTAMPDANYAVAGFGRDGTNAEVNISFRFNVIPASSSLAINTTGSGSFSDLDYATIIVIR